MTLQLATTAFVPEESAGANSAESTIPIQHAMKAVAGGNNVSIPYAWSSAPSETASFALTLVDTAPVARDWVHWMLVDIPPDVTSVAQGASGTTRVPAGARELSNTFGFLGYGGPQPPEGTGAHAYVATLFALDVRHLELPSTTSLARFGQAIAAHVLAFATCTGRLGR
jgi:Raf kinase inhibitor-like YbhB/YbcL family protein